MIDGSDGSPRATPACGSCPTITSGRWRPRENVTKTKRLRTWNFDPSSNVVYASFILCPFVFAGNDLVQCLLNVQHVA
jgi:hypothetical protein